MALMFGVRAGAAVSKPITVYDKCIAADRSPKELFKTVDTILLLSILRICACIENASTRGFFFVHVSAEYAEN